MKALFICLFYVTTVCGAKPPDIMPPMYYKHAAVTHCSKPADMMVPAVPGRKTPRTDGLGFCSDQCACGCQVGGPCTCGSTAAKPSSAAVDLPQNAAPVRRGGGRRGGGGGGC